MTVIMTHTTTHRGVTSTKLCTMIEGKKFCEVQETSPREAGQVMLGIVGGAILWVVFSFITYKVIMKAFRLEDLDDWSLATMIFSLLAPIGYLGLFLVIVG